MPIDFLFRMSNNHSPEVHWRKYYQTEKKIKGGVGLAARGILSGTAGLHQIVFLFLNLGSARAELAFGGVRMTLIQSVSQWDIVITYGFLRAVPVIPSSAFKENSKKKDLGISFGCC